MQLQLKQINWQRDNPKDDGTSKIFRHIVAASHLSATAAMLSDAASLSACLHHTLTKCGMLSVYVSHREIEGVKH